MEPLDILLRNIHIFGGLTWFGVGLVEVFLFTPMLQTLAGRSDGSSLVGSVASQIYGNGLVKIGFPVSATLTFLAGFWLYYRTSDGFDADWMSLTSSMVLSTGVVLGLVALVHGGAVIGPLSAKTRKAAEALAATQPPTDAQLAAFKALKAKHTRHAQLGLVLIAVTLFTMASFRYFGN